MISKALSKVHHYIVVPYSGIFKVGIFRSSDSHFVNNIIFSIIYSIIILTNWCHFHFLTILEVCKFVAYQSIPHFNNEKHFYYSHLQMEFFFLSSIIFKSIARILVFILDLTLTPPTSEIVSFPWAIAEFYRNNSRIRHLHI